TNPTLSPSGDRLAYNLTDPRRMENDIWIRDLARGVTSRFTLGHGNNTRPVWSPDGRTIVFTSDRSGVADLYEKSTRGAGEEKLLLRTDEAKVAASWSSDGRYIAFASRANNQWDVWALPTFGDKKPVSIAVSPFTEMTPMFSPEGRYVAY